MNQELLLAAADTALPRDTRGRLGAYADLETLGNLLSDLGHQCSGACPGRTLTLDGLVWVIPRRGLPTSVALVLFDLNQRPEPLVELIRTLRAVNQCVRVDRIRVLPAEGRS